MRYEWDKNKQATNLRKHGIEFADAVGVFGDPRALTMEDRDHGRAAVHDLRDGWSGEGVGRGVRLPGVRHHPPHQRTEGGAP